MKLKYDIDDLITGHMESELTEDEFNYLVDWVVRSRENLLYFLKKTDGYFWYELGKYGHKKETERASQWARIERIIRKDGTRTKKRKRRQWITSMNEIWNRISAYIKKNP